MIAPVHSLGPGERAALWVQGCTRGCRGCISPELQPHTSHEANESLLAELLRSAARRGCDGLTISGGEPFEQAEGLRKLLAAVRGDFGDILVYTGFRLEELQEGAAGRAGLDCLGLTDVLIDGPYVEALNCGCALRGSENQGIHFLTPEMAGRYRAYMERGRFLESFSHNGAVIITGIQDRRERN